MADSKNKTIPTDQSVEAFLNAIEDERKRTDSYKILEMMKQITGLEPQVWGTSIIGFGSVHYKYDSGREGDMPITGFSPRKQNLTIYLLGGMDYYADLFKQLGKHTTSVSCLYIKRLDDVDVPTLYRVIEASHKRTLETF